MATETEIRLARCLAEINQIVCGKGVMGALDAASYFRIRELCADPLVELNMTYFMDEARENLKANPLKPVQLFPTEPLKFTPRKVYPMQYGHGSIVKVVGPKDRSTPESRLWSDSMDQYIGQTHTVAQEIGDMYSLEGVIDEDAGYPNAHHIFLEEWLEPTC